MTKKLKLSTAAEINDLLNEVGIDDDNGYQTQHAGPGALGTDTHDWEILFTDKGDPERFLKRLKEAGYDGTASIEVIEPEIEDAEILDEDPPGGSVDDSPQGDDPPGGTQTGP